MEIDSTAISSYRDDQMNQLIREAMNSLPEIYREILLLYYFGGMNSNDIARALGVSPTAILQRLTRARAQLREDIIGMIGATFNEKKLGSGFTFHIVEAVKRLKINPVSTIKGLPWGLSLATGLMIAVLSFNPDVIQSNQLGSLSENTIISNRLGKADNGEPKQPDIQNAFMSPQAEGGTWTKKNDMPMAKHGLATCTIDNKIYVIGGCIVNADIYTSLATVEEYDPKNDSWIKKADMPTPRDLFGVGVVDGKIYAIGGETMAGGGGWLTSAVEEYDLKIDKWTKKANIPTIRVFASTVAANGKIYVIGGINGNLQAVPNVDEYDPITDVWTKKADMPNAKTGSAFVEINGKIYIFGGETDSLWNGPVLSIVEEYDPVTDTWLEKSEMPSPLMCSSATMVNNKVYIFGGHNPNKAVTALSSVEESHPKAGLFHHKANCQIHGES